LRELGFAVVTSILFKEAAMDGDRWWEQLVREYEAHLAGVDLASGGRMVARTHAGELCTFGRYERSYAVLLREKEFVTPLAAGSRRAVDEALLFFQQGNNAAAVPVPVVTEAGVKRFFRLVGGAVLVGVATLSTGAILCACQGDQLVFVRAQDDAFGQMDAVSFGRPGSLHDLNFDSVRHLGVGIPGTRGGNGRGRGRGRTAPAGPRSESPKTQAAGGPLRLPASLSAEYDRILARERLAPEDTARVSRALRGCFEALLRRAKKAKVKEEHRSRGGQALPTVTRLLCELALRGAEDLVGLTGRILKKLQEVAGELKLSISPRTLSHALQLLLATKTCLMVREGHTWTIRLEELSDPWSQLHREFVKETPRACRPARAAEATAAPAEATADEVMKHEEGAADAADAAAEDSDDAAATEADPLAPATPVFVAPEAPAADPPEAPAPAAGGGYRSTRPLAPEADATVDEVMEHEEGAADAAAEDSDVIITPAADPPEASAPAGGGYSSTRPPVLAVVPTAAGNLSATPTRLPTSAPTPTVPSSPAAPASDAEERMTLLREEVLLLRDDVRAAARTAKGLRRRSVDRRRCRRRSGK
jgi:hypothetical protein